MQINSERRKAHTMSDRQTSREKQNQAWCYEIRLQGQLDAQWAEWFEGLSVTLEGDGSTLLSGRVIDQAALHGLLKKVCALGLPLLSVNRVEAAQWEQAGILKPI